MHAEEGKGIFEEKGEKLGKGLLELRGKLAKLGARGIEARKLGKGGESLV